MDGRKVAFWIVLGLSLGYSGAVRAQESAPEDLQARMERLEKQNQDLMEALKKLQTSPASTAAALPTGTSSLTENDVQKIVGDYLKTVEQKEAEEVAAQARAEGGPTGPASQLE